MNAIAAFRKSQEMNQKTTNETNSVNSSLAKSANAIEQFRSAQTKGNSTGTQTFSTSPTTETSLNVDSPTVSSSSSSSSSPPSNASVKRSPFSGDLRERSLAMYKSINNLLSTSKKNNVPLSAVSRSEAEASALDFTYLELIRRTKRSAIGSREAVLIRRVVNRCIEEIESTMRDVFYPIVNDEKDAFVLGITPGLSDENFTRGNSDSIDIISEKDDQGNIVKEELSNKNLKTETSQRESLRMVDCALLKELISRHLEIELQKMKDSGETDYQIFSCCPHLPKHSASSTSIQHEEKEKEKEKEDEEEDRTPSWSPCLFLESFFTLEQGGRRTMEDECSMLPYASILLASFDISSAEKQDLKTENPIKKEPIAFFGVYDGHSGGEASEYCRIHMHCNIFAESGEISRETNHDHYSPSHTEPSRTISEGIPSSSIGGECSSVPSEAAYNISLEENPSEKDPILVTEGSSTRNGIDWHSALRRGFLRTNRGFNWHACRLSISSGSTAVTLLVTGTQIYCANVGDSEAVFCRSGKAHVLTCRHVPGDASENARIRQAGGTVVWYGSWRVNGLLSVSRSIGDYSFGSLMSSEPFVCHVERSKEDQFVLMATDGLWSVWKYQEVCDFILQQMQTHLRKEISQLVVDEAIRRKATDNIAVLIIFFC